MINPKNISSYLDSTYLKTSDEAGVREIENKEHVVSVIKEAIESSFSCVMIRPKYVSLAKKIIQSHNSNLKIGTVIDFPLGNADTLIKVEQSKKALIEGAYDIDYVCDYNAFKRKSFGKFDNDILEGTKIVLENHGLVKWIIETGALSRKEIRDIARRITDIIEKKFPKKSSKVFIKTSTGYYGGYGATVKDIKVIKSVCRSLKIKASGGISNLKQCINMIEAGADRIGTSKAHLIIKEKNEFRKIITKSDKCCN